MISSQNEISEESKKSIKNNYFKYLKDIIKLEIDLKKSFDDDNVSEDEFEKMKKNVSILKRRLETIKNVIKNKNVDLTDSEIDSIERDLYQSNDLSYESKNIDYETKIFYRPFPLNYDYNIHFVNLRDIRFSQVSINLFENKETEKTYLDNYPLKFFNYDKNNLVLLRMFGNNDYTSYSKNKYSHNPYVPSLRVVYFDDTNCFVSVDNRRLELIFKQLCLLMSVDPEKCSSDNMKLKNTNDFLRDFLKIPEDVYIYIPCFIENKLDRSIRLMKTPQGVQLEKLNNTLGTENIGPVYAGVIWERVTGKKIDKYDGNPLEGLESFPVDSDEPNEVINNDTSINVFKNKNSCRKDDPKIRLGGFSVSTLIDKLVDEGKIKFHPSENKSKNFVQYENIKEMYYYLSNNFINYLKNGSLEFEEYITRTDLYDNSIKFLPDFDKWKSRISNNSLTSVFSFSSFYGGNQNTSIKTNKTKTKNTKTKKTKTNKTKTKTKKINTKTKKTKIEMNKLVTRRSKIKFNSFKRNHNKTKKLQKNNTSSDKSLNNSDKSLYSTISSSKSKKSSTMHKKPFTIGIDFGGVLAIHRGCNVNMLEHINTEIDMPLALESIEKLKSMNNNLYIISYCGKRRATETNKSINESYVSNYFQDQYYVKGPFKKTYICNYLGCHFMIDDRIDILDNIKKYNNNIITILFGKSDTDCVDTSHVCAKDWNDVLKIISETPYFETTPDKSIVIDKKLIHNIE